MRSLKAAALALIVLAAGAASWRWGSFVAGGSDSYCYVHQAERWADVLRHPLGARLQAVEPLALEAPWPDAPLAFAPAGHVPSRTVPGAIVPICPAGLSIAMAPLIVAGGPEAAFLAIPFFAMMLVVATYAAGARFGARIGLAAALLVVCSPVFLYQAVQPMSDVPAAALWVAAVAWATAAKPRDVALSGLATSAAILMRPNLVPLGFAIGLFLLFRPERTWRQRVRSAAVYAACAAPGCFAVALIQQIFYGSPLASGYGSMSALFSLDHVAPNVARYASWLWESHTPAVAVAALAPLLLPGPLTTLYAGLFVINALLYLPYVVFEDWSFVRFLLPTVPLLLILLVASLDAALRRARVPQPAIVLTAAVLILSVLFVREARDRQAFRLQALEARFERAGAYAGARLPENALLIASRQSGSLRFYADRKTLVWDQLPGDWLDRAMEWSRSRGYEPLLVLEGAEENEFRRHFAGSSIGALDWPPFASVTRVNFYRPADRARYLRGEGPVTEYAR